MRSIGIRSTASAFALAFALCAIVGCTGDSSDTESDGDGDNASSASEFDRIVKHLRKHADARILESEGGQRVIVSAKLQGRIMTASVGKVDSTGFVNSKAIAEGETHAHFNNFGGIDRFWIGPEAGQYGIYFPKGAELTRDTWQVPAAFDKGAFKVVSTLPKKQISMERDMEVTNYRGVKFQVRVQREIGLIEKADIERELGQAVPDGVSYVGVYSDNVMTNTSDRTWDKESGLIGIWILGQFAPSPTTAIIAPFKSGSPAELGPQFNDEYFGKVSQDSPERLHIVTKPGEDGLAVAFRGDSTRVGKVGIGQKRSTGLAGSYDFSRDLLTIVKFSLPTEPKLYGNSTWVADQKAPYGGDVFQTYNNGGDKPGELAAEPFFELESASPVEPLAKDQSVRHRHSTFHFQGPPGQLRTLASKILGADLETVRIAMGF